MPRKTRIQEAAEGAQHVDVVFDVESVEGPGGLDSAKKRLKLTSRGEVLRRAWKFFSWFLKDTDESDVVIVLKANGEIRWKMPLEAIL